MKWYYHVLVFIRKYCHKFEYLKLQGPIKIFLHGIFMNFFIFSWREGGARKEGGKREGRKESLRGDKGRENGEGGGKGGIQHFGQGAPAQNAFISVE